MQEHYQAQLEKFCNDQEYYKAQLEEFRKDDDARWKYEEKELQRQMRILENMGHTDKEFKAQLERNGVNVSALEKEDSTLVQQSRHAHEELLKIEPPPPKRGRKERIIMDKVAAQAGFHTWLYPPAYEGWGSGEECDFNLALGDIQVERHSTGDGWGWEAVAYGTEYCTLWFYYFPPGPNSGLLRVQPHVDFQGDVAVSAHDHWYTSTHAELRLKLHFDLWQNNNWYGEQTATIIDEHHHNSSAAYSVDNHRIMENSIGVQPGLIVWIKLTVSLFVKAHSSHANVDVNFRTDTSRRIRAEHIWVDFNPFVVD